MLYAGFGHGSRFMVLVAVRMTPNVCLHPPVKPASRQTMGIQVETHLWGGTTPNQCLEVDK